jgi:hypothetical protein
MCNNNLDNKHFLLVYLYGDPHHQNTTTIWMQVLNFVENNSGLPILCTGDMNDIMHPNEKSDPGRPDLRRIKLLMLSTVTDHMNLQGINFLSDCAQLVQFLNMQDHTNPPDWRSKHFT